MSNAREALVTTALELFLHEGLQSVGIDRVIKESNVSKMTLYKYFPSKEILIAHVLEHYHHAIIGEIQSCLVNVPPQLPQQMAALLVWYRGKFIDSNVRGCLFGIAATVYASCDHPIHQVCLKHTQTLADLFSALLFSAGYGERSATLALQCLTLLEGTRNLTTIGVKGDPLASAMQVVLMLLQPQPQQG
ncbi:TetR/AcrR family transcriptional regulator [Pseudomonas sp. microsymbiont 2]